MEIPYLDSPTLLEGWVDYPKIVQNLLQYYVHYTGALLALGIPGGVMHSQPGVRPT